MAACRYFLYIFLNGLFRFFLFGSAVMLEIEGELMAGLLPAGRSRENLEKPGLSSAGMLFYLDFCPFPVLQLLLYQSFKFQPYFNLY